MDLNKVSLSASQSVNQNHFSKTADSVFMKFHTNFWFFKDKKVIQPGKKLFWGERTWHILKSRAKRVGKKIVPLMCYFMIYMMDHSCLYDSARAACFGKISFSGYIRKFHQTIRLQKFLSFNITETIWGIKFFFWT